MLIKLHANGNEITINTRLIVSVENPEPERVILTLMGKQAIELTIGLWWEIWIYLKKEKEVFDLDLKCY